MRSPALCESVFPASRKLRASPRPKLFTTAGDISTPGDEGSLPRPLPANACQGRCAVARLTIILPALGSATQLEETLVSVLQNRPDDSDLLVVHPGTYDD